jgi:MFS family permease
MAKWAKWRVLTIYSTFTMLNGAAWCTYSTIPRDTADYYDISDQLVSLFELSFMWTYILVAIPSSYMMHASLRLSISLCSVAMATGACIRYVADHSFAWALVGQSIIALGNTVAMAACAPLAELWFPPHQVILATALGALSSGVGIGAQMIISPAMGNIPVMLGVFAGLAGIQMFAAIFLLDSDLPHPVTSISKCDIGAYFKSKDSMEFLLLSASALGTVSAYEGLIYSVLNPSGYSPMQIGLVGMGLGMSGMLGGLSSSVTCRYCPNVATLLLIYLCIGLVGSVAMCAAVLAFSAFLPVSCIYAFGICGFVPLAIRQVAEFHPEIDSGVPTNILYFSAQIFSLIYSYPAIYFQVLTGYSGLYIIAAFTVASIVPFLLLIRNRSKELPELQPLTKSSN